MSGFATRMLSAGDTGGRSSWGRASFRRQKRGGGGRFSAILERLRDLARRLRAAGVRTLLVRGVLAAGALGILYGGYIWLTLPDISDPKSLIASQSSVIVDRNNVELYRLFSEEDRTFIENDQIPQSMKEAIVAIEDERFFQRGCLDLRAIARVVLRFGQAGGASTITRQLARNALKLRQENIVSRKIKELVLGCQLESRYSKEELLALYLNWIPFGQNAYGIEQASQAYFGIPAKDLSLAQSAVLAALPQRPSYFSPYGKHVRTNVGDAVFEDILAGRITTAAEVADDDVIIGLLGAMIGTGSTTVEIGGRTDQVLKNMEILGFIGEKERLAALEELETIVFTPSRESIRAPHFVLWVKKEVEDMIASGAEEGLLNQGGITIETTLDWEVQQAAEDVVAFHREDFAKRFEAKNIALVALDPGTREVIAYVGNADYADEEHDGKVDMARAARQPGSSFKPLVYAAAFLEGYSPATVLYDVPTKIGDDEPQNFDGLFWGLMTARRALAASRNIPAAKAFFLAGGEDRVLELAARMGAVTPKARREELRAERGTFDYGWPLALGAAETPLLEMAHAYSTLADGGVFKPIVAIRRIKDRHGAVLYETPPTEEEQVLDPRIAYQVTSVLSDVAARPNEYWQSVLSVPGYAAAAKTGTSNKCLERKPEGGCKDLKPSDLWTMGYTPALVAGVWVGNADGTPLSAKAESLSVASPVWRDFMARAHKILKNPKTAFDQPAGIVQLQISDLSGELPTECTPIERRRPEVFLQEDAPSQPDSACSVLEVDKVTGLLASEACPAEAREEKSFLVVTSVLGDRFPLWEQGAHDWATTQMELWNATPDHSGSLLPLPAAPTKACDPRLTPGRLEKPTLTLLFPKDGGSAPYPSFQPRFEYTVGSKVRSITVTIDGKIAGQVEAEPFDLQVQVPRSVQEGGEHEITVTLTDEYFNEAAETADIRFEEDTTAPTVRFTRPRGDATLVSGGGLVMEADAEDDEGGIKYVQFFLNERLLSTKPKAPYRLDYAADIRPGTYRLRAVATDFAGNKDENEIALTVTP